MTVPNNQGLSTNGAYSVGEKVRDLHVARINAVNTLLGNVDRWFPFDNSSYDLVPPRALMKSGAGLVSTNKHPIARPRTVKHLQDPHFWNYVHLVEEAEQISVREEFIFDIEHSIYSAVDNDAETHWETHDEILKGDHFTLDSC